jgi:hypothetical protein
MEPNPKDNPCYRFFTLRLGTDRQDFTTCLSFPTLSLTRGRDTGPRSNVLGGGGFPQADITTHFGPLKVSVLRA